MKVKMLRKKENYLEFVLEDASPAFANALRRIMVSEMPVLAVKWIDVHKNSSALFDEMVAHRMGMIPISFDLSKFNFSEDCRCGGEGCTLCQVVFAVDKTGPATVYSGDMKSSNKGVSAADKRFPITKLLKNQEIKFEAVARLGIGAEHAKHQAAIASYQYYPELVKSGDKRAVSKCPKGVIKLRGSKAVLTDPTKCDLCRSCEAHGVEIRGNDRKFIFRVESVSGLKPEDIVSKAAEILMNKGLEFKKSAGKL